MLDGFLHLFASRSAYKVVIDVIDLMIVTFVVYRVLLVAKGTRAMQMATGLTVVLCVYVASKWFGLITLFNMLSTLLSSLFVLVVVVFQNDIRRALMRVGTQNIFGQLSRSQETKIIDEVVAAATELARHRMGALICFELEAHLDEFVASAGIRIDAKVQRDLLVSLFVPEGVNKLHDGAVVIQNLRIVSAGVFFPMPEGKEAKVLDKSYGTRHRAAIGITEETDAVVVVVSEERGKISVCSNGNIISNLDGPSLRQTLLAALGRGKKNGSDVAERLRTFTSDLSLFERRTPKSKDGASQVATSSVHMSVHPTPLPKLFRHVNERKKYEARSNDDSDVPQRIDSLPPQKNQNVQALNDESFVMRERLSESPGPIPSKYLPMSITPQSGKARRVKYSSGFPKPASSHPGSELKTEASSDQKAFGQSAGTGSSSSRTDSTFLPPTPSFRSGSPETLSQMLFAIEENRPFLERHITEPETVPMTQTVMEPSHENLVKTSPLENSSSLSKKNEASNLPFEKDENRHG